MGARVPSTDSIGRIYALMDSQPLRDLLCDIAHQLKRNKALTSHEGWYVAAVDGHEFFSSRKRCCPQCQTRALTVDGEKVTEYYHQGAVCHLIGQDLALVLDVELLRPGEGADYAASGSSSASSAITLASSTSFGQTCSTSKRRSSTSASATTSMSTTPSTAKGENRLLVQDAAGLFSQQQPGRWVDHQGRRTVESGDEQGFTSCEGVKQPLRFLRTEETVRKRERIAGQWQEKEETTTWSWTTTLTKAQLLTRGLWRCGRRSLGYRERLLPHAGNALGLESLLQARGDGDRQFPVDVVHRHAFSRKASG